MKKKNSRKLLKPTGRRGEVLRLLSDKKVHLTNELRLPPRTREAESSQFEDRHTWFRRVKREGLIKRAGYKKGVAQWQINKKGLKVLKN